jgi:NAD(P)-dependent dehydrogenase (short-subunit alcohol dehydrogenase family)
VTGANSGIGWHTALELARKGAEVVLAARSMDKATDAASRIRKVVATARLVPAVLDLADLSSVRAFAALFADAPLDLLINNAGVMAIPTREMTVDGFERQFGTNYLGPFALTALLLPAIRPEPGSRVVTVSSSAATWGKIDFDNLQSERRYRPMFQAYAQSKLADSIFSAELQRRLTSLRSPIISTAAHPGYALTNLQTSGPGTNVGIGVRIMEAIVKPLLSQDAAQGALPTLYAAVAIEATPGGYYGPDGLFELKGNPVGVPIPKVAQDPQIGKRLWQESERLTGIRWTPPATMITQQTAGPTVDARKGAYLGVSESTTTKSRNFPARLATQVSPLSDLSAMSFSTSSRRM